MNDSPPPSAGLCTEPALCAPADCRLACGLAAVDALLHESGALKGDDVDALLDLRWLLRRWTDAGALVTIFCRLRKPLEERHYLSCFRLRRWLENHIEVRVSVLRGAEERTLPLHLNDYSVEAVRCSCLRAAIREGEPLFAPRVTFVFRVPRVSLRLPRS